MPAVRCHSEALAPFLDYPSGSWNRFNGVAVTSHSERSNLEMSGVDDTPAPPKAEHSREASSSSITSTPEPDAETFIQEHAQVQKRKGGRKPVSRQQSPRFVAPVLLTCLEIYATSEERKQRNRQAQAAFRERRTEYIKQLETTIKHHEDTLQTLQQSHRNAADECLMLRYKNSLLERILLEKGRFTCDNVVAYSEMLGWTDNSV